MNIKSIVAPVVSVIVIAVQLIFGVTIPEEVVNQVTSSVVNVALVGATVYGIFKSHQKKK